jgi:hypothetical protein
MTKLGPSEKLYPVVKIAMVVDSLKEEGVSPKEALAGTHISETQLGSPAFGSPQIKLWNPIATPSGFLESRILPTIPV